MKNSQVVNTNNWPELVIINKKMRTFRIVDFATPMDQGENKRKQKER